MPAWTPPHPAPAPARVAPPPAARGWFRWASSGAIGLIETDQRERFRLRLGGRTVLTLDGAFDAPTLDDLAVARGLLATVEGRRAVVRRIAPNGRAGRARTLGPAWYRGRIVAAVAPNGRAVVAWASSDGGEEIGRPLRVYAAVREAGAAGFGPAQLLDTAHVLGPSTGHLRLAVDARAALLSWSVPDHHHQRRLRLARAGARGGFGAPVELAPQSHLAAVALRADGTALVAWAQGYGVRAAVAGPGAALGPPARLSTGDRAHGVEAAFTRGGRPRVTWRTRRPPSRRLTAVG
jgi:hypothetical protein